jgi:hypothetical protein
MDELFASGLKVSYPGDPSTFYRNGDETEATNVRRNLAICPSMDACFNWAMYQKNVSILMYEEEYKMCYAAGLFRGENSEHLISMLEDGVIFPVSLTMVLLQGDPLLRRVNEVIDRVVEAGIYKYWVSLRVNQFKLNTKKIAIVGPLEGYYSFKLHHMQPAFSLILMGWCLSAICFVVELLYHHVISK